MSGRGGKRVGAGRKPILDLEGRLRVGGRCESVQRRIVDARVDQQLVDDIAETNLPEFWRWVNAIPVPDRKAFLASAVFRDHQSSIQSERERLSRTSIDGRYGIGSRVVREVTDWAVSVFGLRLKPTFVRDCWEEYRTFSKKL